MAAACREDTTPGLSELSHGGAVRVLVGTCRPRTERQERTRQCKRTKAQGAQLLGFVGEVAIGPAPFCDGIAC